MLNQRKAIKNGQDIFTKIFNSLKPVSGVQYYTASILPALVGTTLPFWLNPPGFYFKWIMALEFVLATLFFHTGFVLLFSWFTDKIRINSVRNYLLIVSCSCFIIGSLLGLHLNESLELHKGVPDYIFQVYGLSVLFAAALYILPPFSFYKRTGGELILAYGLGLLPVIGAYLVQVGDITRKVYLVSLPIIVVTGLWIWIEKLISREEDESIGHGSIVILFKPAFSGRYGTLIISVAMFVSMILIVLSKSLSSIALAVFIFIGSVWKIIKISWNEYSNQNQMVKARKRVFWLHMAICLVIVIASLSKTLF